MISTWIGFNVGFIAFILVIFAILQWLHLSTGNFIDWVIAIAIFEWLLIIVTIPWNIYFEAVEVHAEAEISRKKQIPIDFEQVQYAQKIARWSFIVAIGLHLLSAIGFYELAATEISTLGYIGSGAALLLTLLRPVIRGYHYLASRLAAIRQQLQYPREDVVELRLQLETLLAKVKYIEEQLDPEASYSWTTTFNRHWQETRKELDQLAITQTELSRQNQAEHQHLSKKAEEAIAQLSEDGQFLNHVREIIRFFKTA